jgi:hypothetical protein
VQAGSAPNLFVLTSNNILDAADPNEIYVVDHPGLPGSGLCQGVTNFCSGASSNNVFFGSTASNAPSYLTNNILTNPNFATAPSDFRLFTANPASSASTAGLASATDLDGNARSSTNPTPGAYEFVPGASITPRPLVATTTTITASQNPQVPGSSVTFTILVGPNSGTVIPTGQVAVYDGAVKITQLSLDGSGYASFGNSSLAIGAHTITASYVGDLNFGASNGTVSETIGQGIPRLSKTMLSFTAPLDAATAAQTAILSNLGNVPLSIGSFVLGSTEFAITANTCVSGGTSVTLPPGGSCLFSVIFQPTAVSAAPRVVKLSITFTTVAPTQVITLDGSVIVPTYSLSPTSLSLNTVVGVASTSQTVTLNNTSQAPLTINSITIPNTAPFSVTSNTCVAGSSPATLAIGGSCTFAVAFKPILGTSTQRGVLTVNAAPLAVSKTVLLTGTVTAPTYTLSATSLSFAEQLLGTTSVAQGVVVTNSSPLASLTVSRILSPANWILVTGTGSCLMPVTLAPGGTCTIYIALKPSTAGAKTGVINVLVAAPGVSQTISVTGTGIAPITVAPLTTAFGGVIRGTASITMTLTVTNPANNPTLNGLAVGFSGSTDFTRSSANPGTCGTTLAGGAAANSCTINVLFAPAITETKYASDTAKVTVTGTQGQVSQSKTVSLQGLAY